MKTRPGLRFVTIVAVVLCAAIAIRAFASNKAKQTITVTISERTPVKKGDTVWDFHGKLTNADPHCDLKDLTWADERGMFQLADIDAKKAKTPTMRRITHYGSPHVQQTAVFTTVKGLQALANELDPNAKRREKATPTPTPSKPAASPSPGPHVQQTAGLETPQNEKAIAEALTR